MYNTSSLVAYGGCFALFLLVRQIIELALSFISDAVVVINVVATLLLLLLLAQLLLLLVLDSATLSRSACPLR